MRILLLAACLLMATIGCHTARKVAHAVPAADTLAPAKPTFDSSAILKARADSILRAQATLARILGSRIRFETFSAKVKVDYLDTKGKT
ncbi:MAG: hypothetical protein EBZ67_11400, partial [Chitinophagia bacterium]|nr:hypothetical protein [Chitinophagia bacterium]